MTSYAQECVAKAEACMNEFRRLNEIAMGYQNRNDFATAKKYFDQAEMKHQESEEWHRKISYGR